MAVSFLGLTPQAKYMSRLRRSVRPAGSPGTVKLVHSD